MKKALLHRKIVQIITKQFIRARANGNIPYADLEINREELLGKGSFGRLKKRSHNK